jgi:AcrR family transcriptional regulator
MWGREPGTRRGPRPGLSLGLVTEAAIAIADAEGLAGVRMSSVAARLGVSTMALYGYVRTKEELLTAMVDAALPDPPEPGAAQWRDYLADWTRAHRDHLAGRPWLLEISPLTPPAGPRGLAWLDRALTVLLRSGLAADEAVNVATTLSAYATSTAALLHSLQGTVEDEAAPGVAGYTATLTRFVDAENYPGLTAALRSEAFGHSGDWVEDADFAFGLNLLFDGVEVLINRRKEQR